MGQDVLIIIGFVLAVIGGATSFIFWRRGGGFKTLLTEAANRFEESRRRVSELEEKLAKSNEKLSAVKETVGKLEKGIDDARAKSASLVKQLELKEQEYQLFMDKVDRQREHLSKQVEVLTRQLTESDQMRKDAELHFDAASKAMDERVRQAREEAQAQVRDARSRTQDLEKKTARAEAEVDRIKKEFEKVDPEEIRRVKRKTAQYAKLYASMKGLRDMAEERNRNWEVALRKLSTWIVDHAPGKSGRQVTSATVGFGKLVGEALERIGAGLINDDFAAHETRGEPAMEPTQEAHVTAEPAVKSEDSAVRSDS